MGFLLLTISVLIIAVFPIKKDRNNLIDDDTVLRNEIAALRKRLETKA